jgi:hypothetical protein
MGGTRRVFVFHLVFRTCEPPFRNRSRRKAARTLASPISVKSQVNPQVWWRLLPLYPSFSGAAAGNFSRNSLGTAAQAEVATLSTHRQTAIDPVGDKVQF